MYWFSLWLG